MAKDIDQDIPRSVQNLWHAAQVSHRGIVPAADILEAIHAGGGAGKARHSLALGIQESEIWELIHLMTEKVVNGVRLHKLIKQLNDEGFIRRDDLVEWSASFT